MKTKTIWRLAVILAGLACAPARAEEPVGPLEHDAAWREDHDAGWKAYREARLDEAERRLRSAERKARTFGKDDPRLATTLDHLAWVLCAEGKLGEAESLAKRALEMREARLGPDHPEVAQSLNTLACLSDHAGKPEQARPLFERSL